MDVVKTIFKRTIALVILKVSGVLAAGSIGGVELWQSALIAAFVGIMEVAESLARAYVVDGVLDMDEINTAFASSAEAKLAESKSHTEAKASISSSEPVKVEGLSDEDHEPYQ